MRRNLLLFAAGVGLLSVSALAVWMLSGPRVARLPHVDGPQIVQIVLPMANVFLIKSARPILIDAGGPEDAETILRVLAAEGIKPRELGLIVLTHAHADHAGAAAALQAITGAPVALGGGDYGMAAAGRNGDLHPVGLEASLLLPFVSPPFAPFKPDVRIDNILPLEPWGVAGKVVSMPVHTPGSVVVQLDNGEAFVGDLLRGGSLGGMINPGTPMDHYFQPNPAKAREHACDLVGIGIRRFHVGHGGPLDADAVARSFYCVQSAQTPAR
jgi:hydroxyacylglutathione hydrolase